MGTFLHDPVKKAPDIHTTFFSNNLCKEDLYPPYLVYITIVRPFRNSLVKGFHLAS